MTSFALFPCICCLYVVCVFCMRLVFFILFLSRNHTHTHTHTRTHIHVYLLYTQYTIITPEHRMQENREMQTKHRHTPSRALVYTNKLTHVIFCLPFSSHRLSLSPSLIPSLIFSSVSLARNVVVILLLFKKNLLLNKMINESTSSSTEFVGCASTGSFRARHDSPPTA